MIILGKQNVSHKQTTNIYIFFNSIYIFVVSLAINILMDEKTPDMAKQSLISLPKFRPTSEIPAKCESDF